MDTCSCGTELDENGDCPNPECIESPLYDEDEEEEEEDVDADE